MIKIGSDVEFVINGDSYKGKVLSFDDEVVSVWYYDNTGNKIAFLNISEITLL